MATPRRDADRHFTSSYNPSRPRWWGRTRWRTSATPPLRPCPVPRPCRRTRCNCARPVDRVSDPADDAVPLHRGGCCVAGAPADQVAATARLLHPTKAHAVAVRRTVAGDRVDGVRRRDQPPSTDRTPPPVRRRRQGDLDALARPRRRRRPGSRLRLLVDDASVALRARPSTLEEFDADWRRTMNIDAASPACIHLPSASRPPQGTGGQHRLDRSTA